MADVKLSNVCKSFGPVDVIKGVGLEIKKGEFVVFVGPSGCGKSTLLRMISGLEDITSGELQIVVFGVLLVLIMVFLPEGLTTGTLLRLRAWRAKRQEMKS